MLHTIYRVFIIAFLFILPIKEAFPQDAKASFGIVDQQFVIQESLIYKDLNKKLDLLREHHHSIITKHEEELRQKDSDLVAQRNTLSPEALEEKTREFQKEIEKVRQKTQKMRDSYEQFRSKGLSYIESLFIKYLKVIREEKSIKIIARKESFLIYDETLLDVTQETLSRLNKENSSYPESPNLTVENDEEEEKNG